MPYGLQAHVYDSSRPETLESWSRYEKFWTATTPFP